MRNHSFVFGGVDARETYGITVASIERPLFAELRERKMVVPSVSGAIDFGAKYRNEQEITIICSTTQVLTQAAAREVSYWLSKKSKLYLWDEPDKYYVGRIYDAAKAERALRTLRNFELPFICDPCAYGEQVAEQFENSASLRYAGTEETPSIITITNNNAYALHGVTITMREEAEQ